MSENILNAFFSQNVIVFAKECLQHTATTHDDFSIRFLQIGLHNYTRKILDIV